MLLFYGKWGQIETGVGNVTLNNHLNRCIIIFFFIKKTQIIIKQRTRDRGKAHQQPPRWEIDPVQLLLLTVVLRFFLKSRSTVIKNLWDF